MDSKKCLRILVMRYRFIGDTVLAIPFLRNLRLAFPDAIIDVLAEPISGETLVHCPYINEVLFYNPRLKGEAKKKSPHPTSVLSCAAMLRKRKYDSVYILRRSFSSALIPLFAGIPHRVGFATDGRSWLLQRTAPYADKHEVECFLDLLRADNIPVISTHNENWSAPNTDQKVASLLPASNRKRVFICAKSVFGPKDWLVERFSEVIEWLIREQHCEVHFCDAPSNAYYYESIMAGVSNDLHEHVIDWSTRLRIRDVNSLFKHMDLAFGIDTGLLHIAASFHVPVVALFGPLEPWRWHPWDTQHTIIRPSVFTGDLPLAQITAAQACSAMESYLRPTTECTTDKHDEK
jgi:heptosyltransferase II